MCVVVRAEVQAGGGGRAAAVVAGGRYLVVMWEVMVLVALRAELVVVARRRRRAGAWGEPRAVTREVAGRLVVVDEQDDGHDSWSPQRRGGRAGSRW